MKTLWMSAFLLFVIAFSSCEGDVIDINIETGLTGSVQYGEGDCMPIIDEAARTYSKFNGDLYFVVKAELDSLGDGDLDELKANSIKYNVVDGRIAIELPVDTFMVMPNDLYLYGNDVMLVIEEGKVINKNYKFWKCTSY